MLRVCPPSRSYDASVTRWSTQILALVGAFALGTVLAELLGADSLGYAMSFGQIAFTLLLGLVLLRF